MADWMSLAAVGSILVPAVAALTLPLQPRSLRRVAMAACAAAALLAAFAAAGASTTPAAPLTTAELAGWIHVERLPGVLMALYAATAVAAFALAPARDLSRPRVAALLGVVAATLLTCAASNPLALALGWTLAVAPFVAGPFVAPDTWRPRAALAASCVALAVGVALMIGGTGTSGLPTLGTLAGSHAGGRIAFAAIAVAIVLRKGIFPAHAWVADLTGTGALPTTLLVNGHLGALLLARVLLPVFPDMARGSFGLLSNLALFTALYAAVRAVAEPSPRRLLALLVLSQAASILAGLESGTPEGTVGAFIHLAVVAIATTALFGILRAVEARAGDVDLGRYNGFGRATPRLAVAFAVSGLALVGLPGTLGFPAEDLLVHGSLASHPQLGLLLPIATALNAVCLFRLFGRVFLGAWRPPVQGVPDALPRERRALAVIVLALVAGGVLPGLAVEWTGLSAHARGIVAHHTGD